MVACPGRVAAEIGTGIGASPIALAAVAHPGHTYRLPALYVVNTGTVVSTYRVRVERLSPGPGRLVPSVWVRVRRNDVPLEPKQSASVPLTLVVPASAASGAYLSDLVVGTEAPRAPSAQAILGAQAATKLMFRVSGSGGGLLGPPPMWAYPALGAALTLAGGVALQRRLGLRLRLERR